MYFTTASAIACGGYGFNRLDEKINHSDEIINRLAKARFAPE